MSAPPYMRLYVADYLGDTRHLSTEQHGAYLLLLMAMWRAGGSLPNEGAKLARIVGLSPAKWAKLESDVLAFFEVGSAEITHARVKKEIEKSSQISQKRSGAGARGGTSKSLKNNKTALANASDLPAVCHETRARAYTSDIRHQIEEEAKASLSPEGDAAAPNEIRKAFDAWNDTAKRCGLPQARELTDDRRRKIRTRLNGRGLSVWMEALAAVERSPHCRGENDRGWRADLDFVCQPKSFNRLIEGAYEPKASATGPPVVVTDEWLAARTPARKTA